MAEFGTESATSEQKLGEIAGFRAALIQLIRNSRRELCIFSAHLAHPLYHDAGVADALSAFSRSSRFTRFRILVRDTEPMLRQFHRTRALVQRLSSRIELRQIQATVDTPDWEFAVGDGRGLVVCEDREQWFGVYEPDNPVRARKLVDQFQLDWPQAATDPNLRRIQL